MGYLNTFITKQAAGFTGAAPIEGMSPRQWNNFAKELGPLTGQSKGFFRNSANMSNYMAQHGLRTMDDLTAHIQGLRGGGTPALPHAAPAATAVPKVPATPAPANKPINYARRTWDSARSLGRNAVDMGRQGWQATKTFASRAIHNPAQTGRQSWQWAKALAKRNPKLAALLAIGGSLTGGAMLGSAASSGRPAVRQFDASNPYAGFTTTY